MRYSPVILKLATLRLCYQAHREFHRWATPRRGGVESADFRQTSLSTTPWPRNYEYRGSQKGSRDFSISPSPQPFYTHLRSTLYGALRWRTENEESLFLNEESLSPEWIPKLLPFRETQQKGSPTSSNHLTDDPPLVRHRSPRKTAAVKVVLRELEESTEGVEPLYVNCCKNTTFKVYVELCHTLGQIHPKQKSEDLPKSSKESSTRKQQYSSSTK